MRTFFIGLTCVFFFYPMLGFGVGNLDCPTPSISAVGNTTTCQDGLVRLTIDAFNDILYEYQWFKDGVSIPGQTFEDIFLTLPAESGDYTVTATDAMDPGCVSPFSNTITVEINELPEIPSTPSVTGVNPGCAGDDITLFSAEAAPIGGTYRWFKDGISVLGENGQSLIIDESDDSGSYTVEVLSAASCASGQSLSVNITIDPLPPTPAIATTGSTICADGSQVTLTSNLAPDGGAYVWFKDGNVIPAQTSRNLVLNNPDETGNYTVQVVDGDGAMCNSLSSSVETVEIFELPTVAAAGADQQICEETSITLSGNNAVVGIGQWQTSSVGVIINDPNDAQTTVSGLTPGVHEFVWRIDNGTCIGTPDLVTIEIFADPSPAVTEDDKVICDLTATSISADGITVGAGLWEVISGSATIADATSPNTTISNLSLNSNVVLSWTVTNGICTEEKDELSIQVGSSPSLAVTGANQQLCDGTSTTLGATAPTIGNGQWTVLNGTASIQESSNPNSEVTGLTPGENVTLRWTVSNVCGSNSNDLVIENEAAPDIANAGNDQELCVSTTTTLAGSGNGGLWTVIDGTASFANPTSPNTTVSNLSIGVNRLRYTIDAAICDDSFDEVNITVFEDPSDALVGNDIVLCEGETTVNVAANVPSVGRGHWTVLSGGGTIAEPGNVTTAINDLPLGETILQWEVSNGICNSKTDNLRVFVFPSPGVESNRLSVCEGESVELLAIGGNTYSWSPSVGLSATDIANPIASPTANTTYVVAIGREGCDDAQFEVNVVVDPNPVVTVSDDTTIFIGQEVQLFARGAEAYSWTPVASLSDPTSASPIAAPRTTTIYTVVGSNEFNCTDDADVTVTVDTDFEIFVPDLFSPNGDQVNDVLLVNTLGVESFEFRVYDRKGREMFVSDDASTGWNGTFNGSDAAMDNYIYYVAAELISGERVTRKGSVQLIR